VLVAVRGVWCVSCELRRLGVWREVIIVKTVGKLVVRKVETLKPTLMPFP